MNERLKHRYKIWELAKKNLPKNAEPPPAIQVDKLVAMMALYDYRPLIDVQLRATCGRPNGAPLACKTTRMGTDAVDLVCDVKLAS